MSRRTLGTFYSPLLEALPLVVLFAVLYVAYFLALPHMIDRTEGLAIPPEVRGTFQDIRLYDPTVIFPPILAALFYAACTFGAWIAVRVEDPARDINWLLVRINPSKVMADPAQKERYLASVVRSLFLAKTCLLLAILFAQYWWFKR